MTLKQSLITIFYTLFFESRYRRKKASFGEVEELHRCGISKIESFFPESKCKLLREQIDTAILREDINLWRGHENADLRIFGLNQISTLASDFFLDKKLRSIAQDFEALTKIEGFSMGAKITHSLNNKGSGEGWHRDRCDKRQTKFILYLSDVTESNGPFQYVKGSESVWGMLKDFIKYGINPANSRVPDEKVELIIKKEPSRLVTVTGKAGTVLIANTRGIHRGMPLKEDSSRYAITNYYWLDSPIPAHIKQLSVQPNIQL